MTFTRKSSELFIIFCVLILTETSNGELGGPCEYTSDCRSSALQCLNFVCTCWSPYIPDATNKICSIVIDGQCERSGDVCYDPNASCSIPATLWGPSFCVCKTNFFPHPETRICLPSLGSNCTSDGLACIAGSCVDGTCECGAGLVPSQNNETCGIPTGGACSSQNSNCAEPAAHCSVTTNTCECNAEYQSVVEDDRLICKLALGMPCASTDECAALNTTCEALRNGNLCTCALGYVPSLDRTSCLRVTDHWPGTCQENLQCSAMFGRYSSCQIDGCGCVGGYIYVAEDFGCVPIHTAIEPRTSYESVKLLATTLLPYLPTEAKFAVDEILDKL